VSELRRWSEEGATREERLLVDSSRGERPDPAAHARTRASLGIGECPKGAPASEGGAAGPAPRGGLAKLLAIGAGVVAIGATTVGAVWFPRVHITDPRSTAVATRSVAGRPPADPLSTSLPGPSAVRDGAPAARSEQRLATPDAVAGQPMRVERSPVRPTKRPRRLRREAPVPLAWEPAKRGDDPASQPSLAEEVAALEGARASLATRDPVAALRSLDRYRARFVHGRLASEEVVLRIRALLARDDRAGAVATEREFLAAHPDSPYLLQLRELLHPDESGEKK